MPSNQPSEKLDILTGLLKDIKRIQEPRPVEVSSRSRPAGREEEARPPAEDPQARLLRAMATGPMSVSQLATASGLPPSGLLTALQQLQSFSLIDKQTGSDDKVVFRLTPGGRELLEALPSPGAEQ